MSCNFWKFASVLEKDFGDLGVSYDRYYESVNCPECEEILYSCDWEISDYAFTTSDGYIVYRCPVCGKVLTVRPIEE